MLIVLGIESVYHNTGLFLKSSMMTTLIGAVINVILDPIFILCLIWVCVVQQ